MRGYESVRVFALAREKASQWWVRIVKHINLISVFFFINSTSITLIKPLDAISKSLPTNDDPKRML